jgi:hypothetical protein
MEAQQTSGDTQNGVMPSADFSAGTGVNEDEEDQKWTVGVMDGSETESQANRKGEEEDELLIMDLCANNGMFGCFFCLAFVFPTFGLNRLFCLFFADLNSKRCSQESDISHKCLCLSK